MNKRKVKGERFVGLPKILLVLSFSFVWFSVLSFPLICFAQEGDLEFTLDTSADTIALPKIFKPNIDLSGRGFHRDPSWPQTVAAKEVLETWQKDIGFNGFYRLQYNLWEISQLYKNREAANKLLSNYDTIIKNISDSGGVVILDIFGTPAELGKVLDKKSAPVNLKAFKELVKKVINDLSCKKKYNVWYEVWNAPDLDDFFLGRKQEYLALYRQVAEAIKELEARDKIHIPIGGPNTSWWFQNLDGNTILAPEKSLIYELIKFCYSYHLPLDFIVWHGYATSPSVEKENTIYKKTAVSLIRDWLTYFKFDKNTPLIVDEWNYDRQANVLPERKEKSFICASYIPSRLKNMYEAGVDGQLYFCLEDFQNNKEGVIRNVGVFYFDSEHAEYKGGAKSIYNVLGMLAKLGGRMFLTKLNDDFVGAIVTKSQEEIALLIYNYIDPDIVKNFLSQNIATLNNRERRFILDLIESDKLNKILARQLEISGLRTTNKVKAILRLALVLNDNAKKFEIENRNIRIGLRGLNDGYLYSRFKVDSSCSLNCEFLPIEQKEVAATELYQEALSLSPYSVQMIILKKKPPQPPAEVSSQEATQPAEPAKDIDKDAKERK